MRSSPTWDLGISINLRRGSALNPSLSSLGSIPSRDPAMIVGKSLSTSNELVIALNLSLLPLLHVIHQRHQALSCCG